MLVDDREHLGRREVLEARPAQVLVGPAALAASLPSGKMRRSIGLLQAVALFSSSVCRSSSRRRKSR